MPNNGYYLSAYQIAVNHGFTGTQQDWIELLCGNYVKMMDHRNLNGREAGGAHPISAIAGLDEKLAELKESIDYPESVNKTEELVLVPITLNQTGEKLNTAKREFSFHAGAWHHNQPIFKRKGKNNRIPNFWCARNGSRRGENSKHSKDACNRRRGTQERDNIWVCRKYVWDHVRR